MKKLRFDPPSVVFPHTYIGASSRFVVEIVNEGDKIQKLAFRASNAQDEDKRMSQIDVLDPAQRDQISTAFQYSSDVFSIEPMELELWPRAAKKIQILFAPKVAKRYTSIAYVKSDGVDERQKLEIMGTGLPPVAELLTSQISVGNVFLDGVFEYRVMLKNIGKVPVDFALEKHDANGLTFEFSPESGQVPVGNEMPVFVKFIATQVGEFSETFVFRIRGANADHPQLTLSGKVIGPSFTITPRAIDFEGVGLGFLHSRVVHIENKSEIPFDFRLRMSHDGSFERREFQLNPEFGTVEKFGKQDVVIEFIPTSIKSYSLKLLLDVERVGKEVIQVPITATCVCPDLTLTPEVRELKTAFIGYKYTEQVVLQNAFEYAARFEVLPQDVLSRDLCVIEVDKMNGVVNPQATTTLNVSLTTQKLGRIEVECFVRVVGSDKPPLRFLFQANSIGPSVSLSTKSIKFDRIPVLRPKTEKLVLSNSSLIPANYQIILESPTGGFAIAPEEGTIPPKSTANIDVSCRLNDLLTFTGTLRVRVEYMDESVVTLKATGSGSPVVSTIDMETIDFGYLLTEQQTTKSFTLKNKSHRKYELRFTAGKVQTPKEQVNDLMFQIEPDHAVIDGHTTQSFTMKLFATTVTAFTMPLLCQATVGKQRIQLFNSTVKGDFIQPLLSFSTNKLEFIQQYVDDNDTGKEISPDRALLKAMRQELTITNKSKLALPIFVMCPQPFNVNRDSFVLESGAKVNIQVGFNSLFKKDFVSETLERKLVFSFADHPETINVRLKATLTFPNIHLESTDPIDFGVVMMNIEETKTLKLTNNQEVPVKYEWKLLSDDTSANEVFDVFPIYATLMPNESVDTHFRFYALPHSSDTVRDFEAVAVCHVSGGPDYAVPLKGSSAPISFRVCPTSIEFPVMCFSQEIKSKVVIANESKVMINFTVKIPRQCGFKKFSVTPKTGIIGAEDEAALDISILPGLPRKFSESFFVQIGTFEDVQVHIDVDATFEQVSISLDRHETDPALVNLRQLKMKRGSRELDLDNTLSSQEQFHLDDLLHQEKKVILTCLKEKMAKEGAGSVQKGRGCGQFYIAKYFVNLGELILSQAQRKTFAVRSRAPFHVTFELDVTSLRSTGFKIEPTIVQGLTPDSEVSIEISFSPMNRRTEETGPMEFPIPIKFSDGHQLLVVLGVDLKLPILSFSTTHCDFGDVIIRQKRVISVQLQNMSAAACEFSIDPPTEINSDSRNAIPFCVVPYSGILPPSSFMNLAVHFTPSTEKMFNVQFPINMKYNPNPTLVTVSGKGTRMSLVFDPPTLVLPPIHLFSEPSTATVTVTNPTQYPIEFYSTQFDRQLYEDGLVDPRQMESPFVTYTPKAKTPVAASKFSVCIIVNGPPQSGKTTMAKKLSAHFGFPVIDLKDHWDDAQDHVSNLYATFRDPACRGGVIIDGLNAFVDRAKDEAFLQQCLKQKNIADELAKNPFYCVAHTQQSTLEDCLDALLSSLDGHFVFQICLKLSPEASTQRMDDKTEEETREKERVIASEKEALFNMSEEVYEALSSEEKEEVDQKRAEYRRMLIEQIQNGMPGNTKKENKSKKKQTETSRNPQQTKKRTGRTSQISQDPIVFQSSVFQYSLGSITQKVQNPDRFKVLDPAEVTKCEIASEHMVNTIILDGQSDPDCLLNEIMQFIPPIQTMKEAAFRMQLPDPVTFEECEEVKLASTIPQLFSIVVDEDPEKPSEKPSKGDKSAKSNKCADADSDENLPKNLTNRWHLQPHGQTSITIQYDPTDIGASNDQLLFAITNCRMKPSVLKVKGFCGYPDVDRNPAAMFKNIIPRFDAKQKMPAYLSNSQELSFGYCMFCKERTGKQPPFYRDTITFSNNSQFPVELSSVFIDQAGKGPFSTEPASLVIQPSESGEMTIGFHPTSAVVFKRRIGFYIKDNPDPFYINVVGESMAPVIELSTTNVEFDKMLVKNEKSRKIELKNKGKLASMWKLKGCQALAPAVTFSAQEGKLLPGKSGSIVCKFASAKPVSLKKSIAFEVFDIDGVKQFNSTNIAFSGESFDVNFDMIFGKGQSEQFDFGQLKIGQEATISVQLRNRGKYPVDFKFRADPSIAKCLKISATEGTVNNSDKPQTVSFTFQSPRVVKFNLPKCITLDVIEAQTKTTTATLTYPLTVATFVNSYTISCGKALSFGDVAVNAPYQKEFTITNTGPFPFDFELKATGETEAETTRKTTRGSKLAKQKKTGAALSSGFSITPNTGTIQTGASTTIVVDLNAQEAGKIELPVILKVPDVGGKNEQGREIKFVAAAYSCGILVSGNDRIFPRLPLLTRSDIVKSNLTSFLEDERVLHFAPCTVGSKDSVNVRLINVTPIEVQVDITMKYKGKTAVFDVSDKLVTLPPNGFHNLVVTFTPPSADNFTAAFDATVKNGTDPVTKSLKFNIEGTGSVPTVTVKSELAKGKGNSYALSMGKTLVGLERQKMLAFGNDGLIPITVQASVKQHPDFQVSGVDFTNPFVVDPGKTFTVTVVHKPQKQAKGQVDLTITPVDNPKGSIQIQLQGEGFCDDIVFDGLGGEDELRFRGAAVGIQQTVTFTMKNVSDEIMRFVWNAPNDIVFSPRVGHLHRFQVKEITATFSSEKPMKLNGAKGTCQIAKIILDNDKDDWDDTQKMVSFVPRTEVTVAASQNSKSNEVMKVAQVRPEPPYRLVNPGKPKDINIKIFAVADNLKCSLTPAEINFSPTMMFQTRYTELKLTNQAQVRMEYRWVLDKFESLRTDYAQTRPPAFAIEPESGFVEAGQATTFRAIFSPQEVDDFVAKFICRVPHLQAAPPSVTMSGLSRRPLCHFNIPFSDYLSRRSPECTEALPEGVRVIEIFSKGVRSRSVKKVEVINPTASGYEARWSMIRDNSNGAITCDQPKMLISGGKKQFFSFSFSPRDASCVECLYEFDIPEHNVKAYFLFVGRISR